MEKVDNSTLNLTVTLPSKQYFYYPAITVNLKGLKKQNISSIASGDAVSGLSYADIEDGVMLNIDCRKFLIQHATHFVVQYQKDKSNKSKKTDAVYFINQLKASDTTEALLKQIKCRESRKRQAHARLATKSNILKNSKLPTFTSWEFVLIYCVIVAL